MAAPWKEVSPGPCMAVILPSGSLAMQQFSQAGCCPTDFLICPLEQRTASFHSLCGWTPQREAWGSRSTVSSPDPGAGLPSGLLLLTLPSLWDSRVAVGAGEMCHSWLQVLSEERILWASSGECPRLHQRTALAAADSSHPGGMRTSAAHSKAWQALVLQNVDKEMHKWGFPGGSVAKTLYSQCWGHGFHPWSGN